MNKALMLHLFPAMLSNSNSLLLLTLHYILLFSALINLFQPGYSLATTPTSTNETDFLSLIAIKNGIGGLNSWTESSNFCQWKGVICSKLHQRVMALNLSGQSLVGSIPPHIGNLSFLKFINLKDNSLYGEIPKEIGKLFRLQHLNMSNNSFGGEIPVNLIQCTNLKIINLGRNKLTGKIPMALGSLSKLVTLVLDINNLTGEIPPSLGNLSSLQMISIGDNKLEGSIPETLAQLSNLTFFLFAVNRLSRVPLSLYNSSSINLFSIGYNQLYGNLSPDIFTTLPNVQKFGVPGNQFSGPIPVSLSNASKLQLFDISYNSLTGQVPNGFGGLESLNYVNMGVNNLGNKRDGDLDFVTSLTNCSNLEILCVDKNNFGGVLPNSVSNLSTQLNTLCLGRNHISGVIPEGIGNLVNLIGLGLEYNSLTSSIPSSIGRLQKLQVLYLNINELSGQIPSSLGNITHLTELYLGANRMEGNIPSSLGDYQSLGILNLSRNNLNSTIPREVIGLSSLSVVLDLSHNSLIGSLPSDVGNLKTLQHLDISRNKLSGKIPTTLSNLLSLEYLDLNHNFFEGSIPQSLSSLRGIHYFDLSSNNLSGQIPRYLQTFSSLEKLNLSWNELEGDVPSEGAFRNASAISVAGNTKLCGGIQELQLPTCHKEGSTKQGRSLAFKLAIAICVPLSFLLISSATILYWKRKPKLKASSTTSMKDRHFQISYRKLFQATDGFSPTNFLGSGAFGHVYKGTFNPDKTIVAVKVFNLQQKGGAKSFMVECESLRNIRHRNLLRILTSCSSTDFDGNDFKALVFEFMPNGSLENWLHQDMENQNRPWNLNMLQRLNIALDVASALEYLHHDCYAVIIHRDLKPSNVLLDDYMVAHVSDFGIAKLLSVSVEYLHQNQSTSTGVKGSIGYAAPEYGMGGEASTRGDVYSYGILLLEMFIGRRPTDEMFKDGLNIHSYASEAIQEQVIRIVDPVLLSGEDETIIGNYDNTKNLAQKRNKLLESVTAVIRIGVACSAESPAERRDMRNVTKELHLIRDSYLGTEIH